MSRRQLRRPLAWGLAATILLPMVVALLLGLGRLLAALDDEPGAVACDRIALLAAILWALAVVATTIINATVLMRLGAAPATGAWGRGVPEGRMWRRALRDRQRRPRHGKRRRRQGRHQRTDHERYRERHHDEDSGPGAMP